jgi:hypothetical protein
LTGLPGFKGYLWYPFDGGFVAISLFDSVESATASNEAAKSWTVPNVVDYTDGHPQIVNVNVIHADLPILAPHRVSSPAQDQRYPFGVIR